MLESAKNALRENGNASDAEIQDLIDAAKADLSLSGVHMDKINDYDPIIKRAIILYCKAHYGYDDMGERFAQSYESLKNHLTLSTEYTTGDSS